MITSLGSKNSRTKFIKIMAIETKKTFLANSYWSYPLWQTSRKFLLGSTSYSGITGVSYKIVSLTPKSLLKTKFFKKRQPFQKWEDFGLFFLVLSNMTNLREQLIRLHKVFWQELSKQYDRFFRALQVENQIFQKKASVQEKKIFANSFWCYPLWQTSAYLLLCSTRFYGIYDVS